MFHCRIGISNSLCVYRQKENVKSKVRWNKKLAEDIWKSQISSVWTKFNNYQTISQYWGYAILGTIYLSFTLIVHSRCRYFAQVNHWFGEKVIRKMRLITRKVSAANLSGRDVSVFVFVFVLFRQWVRSSCLRSLRNNSIRVII